MCRNSLMLKKKTTSAENITFSFLIIKGFLEKRQTKEQEPLAVT